MQEAGFILNFKESFQHLFILGLQENILFAPWAGLSAISRS